MAKMYPDSIDLLKVTESEKMMFNQLKIQLPDRISVFYSVSWYNTQNGRRENSESDFVIFDPDFGFLTIEVKGGKALQRDLNGTWELLLDESEKRILKRSPYKQAEESMFFLKEYYYKQYNVHFSGAYGFACAFPMFNVSNDLGTEAPKNLTIDFSDMNNLKRRINEIFHYWSSTRSGRLLISAAVQENFLQMLHRRITVSAVIGANINRQQEMLTLLNRVQDNYLDFVENYHQAFIVGGAGTGKTWMAVKKAMRIASKSEQHKVLLLCYNSELVEFLSHATKSFHNIICKTFHQLIKDVVDEKTYEMLVHDSEMPGLWDVLSRISSLPQYHAIILDEAQDFNEEWACTTRLFLRNDIKSTFYVFYDSEQNIFNRNFKNGFLIENPPLLLRENLRNTAEIAKWVKEKTSLGYYTKINNIAGTQPEYHRIRRKKDARKKLEDDLRRLVLNELVPEKSIVVLSNRRFENSILGGYQNLGPFTFIQKRSELDKNKILFRTVQGYKGLESDVVIYLKHCDPTSPYDNTQLDFVAYTRAKFLLFVIECSTNQ